MRFSLLFSILVIAVSCNHAEDYQKEAEKICSCMSENGSYLETIQELEVNLGVCLLGAKVNLKDPEMITEIGRQCPELKEGYESFVSRLKTDSE